jgi:hypothetical protein
MFSFLPGFFQGDRVEESMNRKKRIFLQRKMYDHLFYEEKNPHAANLCLLIFELEEHYSHHGVKPCFGDFSASKEMLDAFIVRNKETLGKSFSADAGSGTRP